MAPQGTRTRTAPGRSATACGHRWSADFPASLQTVAAVRAQARDFLNGEGSGASDRLDETVLVISELVTNTVRHTGSGGTVRLTTHPDGVDVDVSDPSRVRPASRPPDLTHGTGGLGLPLVAALCDRFAVTLDPGSGKTVHAHLAWTTPTPPTHAQRHAPAAPATVVPDRRRRGW
jgi:anti-sigma regulatory factor (Ser/Thr protein kinase)